MKKTLLSCLTALVIAGFCPESQILSFLADKIAKNPPELLYKWLRDNNYKLNISRNTYYKYKRELKEEILEKKEVINEA